jgi:hypothetical protein
MHHVDIIALGLMLLVACLVAIMAAGAALCHWPCGGGDRHRAFGMAHKGSI